MAQKKKVKSKLLNAYFIKNDFVIEETPEEMDQLGLEGQEELKEWVLRFNKNKYEALYHLGFSGKADWFSPALEYLYRISLSVIREISRQPDIEYSREITWETLSIRTDEVYELIEGVPFVIGREHIGATWVSCVWNRLLLVFCNEIKEYDGTVARYFEEKNSDINVSGRVFFHLVENKDQGYPFAFMATYSTKPAKSKRALHTPLKNSLVEYKDNEKLLISLLSTVVKAADKSSLISKLMESGELFSPLKFTTEEAYTFLREIPLYEDAGIMCRVPDWWRKKRNSFQISVAIGEKEPSLVGLDSILDFHPVLRIGDEYIPEKEMREFLSMAEGLVQYKGKWVEVNREKLEDVLEAFEKVKDLSNGNTLTLGEAMRLELHGEKVLGLSSQELEVSVSNGEWFRSMKEFLARPTSFQAMDTVPSFKAQLRAYQGEGYRWLHRMWQLGFGACLADDMGLGKTVQVIAFLEYLRINHGGKALLVLPASLIGNWQHEIERFAPEMTYDILHKSAGKSSEDLIVKDNVFLHITTYGMAARLEELKDRRWDVLILDEAQAIKNPGTKQSKSVKKIPSGMRIALTGTPIENSLSDLWSLFDFLNHGLLGSSKEFSSFVKGLSDDGRGYVRLRKMISPFLLRRLKTDKSIISDLPDKIEINEYAALSKKQVSLYKQLVGKLESNLQESEGIERKGLILSSIMKFKQICNHPDHYLGREEFKSEGSGKFELLRDICQTIYEKRERVIVFTQFKEMTEPISELLTGIFHKEGFVLHGGTSVKNRNKMVEQFNGESYVPFMVLSLKAGGVGLNLTSANHVIHFDRWWNPAVENQATDRAFRIGQTKNVMVHKFVTKGTIEEKIDSMIQSKEKLAGDILSSGGEQWITEYSNEELMELFLLGGEVK